MANLLAPTLFKNSGTTKLCVAADGCLYTATCIKANDTICANTCLQGFRVSSTQYVCAGTFVESPIVCATSCFRMNGSGARAMYLGSTDSHATIYLDGSNGDWSGSDYAWIRHDNNKNLMIENDQAAQHINIWNRSNNNICFGTNNAGRFVIEAGGNTRSCYKHFACTCLQSPIVCSTTKFKGNCIYIDGGNQSAGQDATVYITSTSNDDWALLVNKCNSGATEYGIDVRMGATANAAYYARFAGTVKFKVQHNCLCHSDLISSTVLCAINCVHSPKFCATSGSYYLNLNDGILNVPTQYTNCIHNASSTAVMRFTSGFAQACTCLSTPIVCATNYVKANILCATATAGIGTAAHGTYPLMLKGNTPYQLALCNSGAGDTNYPWLVHTDDNLIIHFNGIADRFYFHNSGAFCANACVCSPLLCATTCIRTPYIKTDIIEQNAGAANLCIRTEGGTGKNIILTPNGAGTVIVNGTDNNSGKADLSVHTGGSATIALSGAAFRVGSDDVNWSLRIRNTGQFETYGQNVYLAAHSGDRHVILCPSGTGMTCVVGNSYTSGCVCSPTVCATTILRAPCSSLSCECLVVGKGGIVPVIKAGGGNTDLRICSAGTGGWIDFHANSAMRLCISTAGAVCAPGCFQTPMVCATNYVQLHGTQAIQLASTTHSLKIKNLGTAGSAGIVLQGSGGAHLMQLYGTASDYGFLDAAWGSWDIKKSVNGSMCIWTGSSGFFCNMEGAIFAATCLSAPAVCATGHASISAGGDCCGLAVGQTYSNQGGWHTQVNTFGSGHNILRIKKNAGNTLDNAQCLALWVHDNHPATIYSSGYLKICAGGGVGMCFKNGVAETSILCATGYAKIGATCVCTHGGTGRLKLHGIGDNSMYVGPYEDNGWGYIESINNSNGIYFGTNQGSFQFDTGSLGSYTDGEVDVGYAGKRFRCGHFSSNICGNCFYGLGMCSSQCVQTPIVCGTTCVYATQFKGSGKCIKNIWHGGGSDFADGTLVTTDIPSSNTNGESFVLEVTGKSYSSSRPPFSFMAQGYLYNDTIIAYTGVNVSGNRDITYLKAMNCNGNLAFWWPRIGYWNSFSARVCAANSGCNTENRVTNVYNSVDPSGATKKVTICLQRSYTSDNFVNGNQLVFSNTVGSGQATIGIKSDPLFCGTTCIHADADSKITFKNAGTNAIAMYADSGDELYLASNNAASGTVRYPSAGGIDASSGVVKGPIVCATNYVCSSGNINAACEICAGGWFRNCQSGEGLYNNGNGQHWYASSSSTWTMSSNNTVAQILFNSCGAARGYFRANNANEVGIMDGDGHWAYFHTKDTRHDWRINDVNKLCLTNTCLCSSCVICANSCLRSSIVCATSGFYGDGSNITGISAGYDPLLNTLCHNGGTECNNVIFGKCAAERARVTSGDIGVSVIIGRCAGYYACGTTHTFVGVHAGRGYFCDSCNHLTYSNTAVGYAAGENGVYKDSSNKFCKNTFIGAGAGGGQPHCGSENTVIGADAGDNMQGAACGNTFIGYYAGYNCTTASNQLVMGSYKTSSGLAAICYGCIKLCGAVYKASGSFLITHPDPEKRDTTDLFHSFVESPTAGDNIYRWQVDVQNCCNVITLPDYYRFLNEDDMVWVSPYKNFGSAYGEVTEDQKCLIVCSNQDGKYNVLLIGTRKDECATASWKGAERGISDLSPDMEDVFEWGEEDERGNRSILSQERHRSPAGPDYTDW